MASSTPVFGEALCPEPASETATITLDPNNLAESLLDEFGPQIREYLNIRGSSVGLESMIDSLNGSVLPVEGFNMLKSAVFFTDVTGDGVEEVLVDLVAFFGETFTPYDGFVSVYGCSDGSYREMFTTYLCCEGAVAMAEEEGIRAVRDMNGNSLPEIVLSNTEVIGTHAYYGRSFRILEWDGAQFVDLVRREVVTASELEVLPSAYVDSGDGVIRDTNADGLLELILTQAIAYAYPDLGPQRVRDDIWGWNGSAYVLIGIQHSAPEYRIQAVWDGDDASRFGDYDTAATFYQQAIFDTSLLGWSPGQLWPPGQYYDATPAPDPGEWRRLEAYSRYRVLLLHVAQGNLLEAETVYSTLQDKFPQESSGGQYAELASRFWEEYKASGDLESSCRAAVDFARTAGDALLKPLGFQTYSTRVYEPENICLQS